MSDSAQIQEKLTDYWSNESLWQLLLRSKIYNAFFKKKLSELAEAKNLPALNLIKALEGLIEPVAKDRLTYDMQLSEVRTLMYQMKKIEVCSKRDAFSRLLKFPIPPCAKSIPKDILDLLMKNRPSVGNISFQDGNDVHPIYLQDKPDTVYMIYEINLSFPNEEILKPLSSENLVKLLDEFDRPKEKSMISSKLRPPRDFQKQLNAWDLRREYKWPRAKISKRIHKGMPTKPQNDSAWAKEAIERIYKLIEIVEKKYF